LLKILFHSSETFAENTSKQSTETQNFFNHEEVVMPNSVRLAKYYKMMVPHKTGQGIKLLEHLQKSKVNLLAFLAFPEKGKAQVDCVPVAPAKFTAAAKKAKWNIIGPKACFVIEAKDQVGAFVPYIGKLAKAKINIRAAAAVRGGAGRCGAVLWVNQKDVRKAAKALGAK
jgi:hypothetical protein